MLKIILNISGLPCQLDDRIMYNYNARLQKCRGHAPPHPSPQNGAPATNSPTFRTLAWHRADGALGPLTCNIHHHRLAAAAVAAFGTAAIEEQPGACHMIPYRVPGRQAGRQAGQGGVTYPHKGLLLSTFAGESCR